MFFTDKKRKDECDRTNWPVAHDPKFFDNKVFRSLGVRILILEAMQACHKV
jgi:hypothetical protein